MQKESELFIQAVSRFRQRDFIAAEKMCRRILAANKKHADSLHMMAAILKEKENYTEAANWARGALSIDPTVADFHYTYGLIAQKKGKMEEALASFNTAIQINPNHVRALVDLGIVFRDLGSSQRNNNLLEAALKFFNRALFIKAEEETYYNIAYIYSALKQYRHCIEAGKACLKRYPDSKKMLNSLAATHDLLQEYEEALDCYHKLLAIEPDNPETHANLANTLKNLGHVDESILAQKKALQLSPNQPWIYSNLFLTMIYSPSVTPEELAYETRKFGEIISDPLIRTRPFTNDRNKNRKLRIGYVSPDFRDHAVNFFLSPIYRCNKDKFEIFAYSKVENEDAVTARIKNCFDHWRDIKFLRDDQATDLIEADKIDILVDLAGHTAKNGLMIFARKPAPIQVTWLGHPATTGMKAIDYRITDSYAEPPGMTEHLNTETLWRLPQIFCAYAPPENSPPVIPYPPSQENGYITFGCFNNFTKVTDAVLEAWSKIMKQVPDSRLLLEIPGVENKKILGDVHTRLMKQDLPLDLITIEPRTKANQFVLYNKIDIALDPFPCVGGTTSMDTLWMGVPLITLAGKHFASRMGVTILKNAGLPELIAEDVDEYISKAVNLANNREELKNLRTGLHEKFALSPVMDQEAFARNMEDAYFAMWDKWLGQSS